MSEGNEDGGFLTIGQMEELVAKGDIEVTDPARAKTSLGSSQTDMLGGNADVHNAMCMTVEWTHPFLIVVNAADDDQRSRKEPVPGIALMDQRQRLGGLAYVEMPRLAIASRRGQTGTLEDILEVFG